MKQFFPKKSMMSIATAIVLGLTGCGGGSGDSTTDPTVEPKSTTITGKAVDGYLVYATVCLDLNRDGYCQLDKEPATSTDLNGSFTLTITPEQQADANYTTAPLLVYSGYDSDTRLDFTGKLKAPFNEAQTVINITPVTTMVESMVAKGKSPTEAEVLVKKVLNLPADTNLSADPVEEAQKDPQLLKAALQVQKSVEVLAKALKQKDTNTTVDEKELVEDLYEKLAEVAETAEGDSVDLNATFETLVETYDLGQDINSSVIAISTKIEELIDSEEYNDTAVIGTTINTIQDKIVKDVIEGDYSFEEIEADIADINPLLEHAYDILDMVHYTGSDIDSMAIQIQESLAAAGMSDRHFLSIEEEIIALKNSSDPVVQKVGTDFELALKRYETEADKVETLATAETIPFNVPVTFYEFEDNGYTSYSLKPEGLFDVKRVELSQSGLVEVNSTNPDAFVLVDGSWVPEENLTSYQLSDDKSLLTVDQTEVMIVKKIDLAHPAEDDKDLIEEINEKVPGDTPVTFNEGAEAYLLAFKEQESYRIYQKELTHGNMGDSYGDYYKTLEDFITGQSGGHWFMGDTYGGLAFEKPFDGTLKAGDSGNLVRVMATTNGDEIVGIDGQWRVIQLPGSDALAIVVDNVDDESTQLFTVKDGIVYRGEYHKAMESFDLSDTLDFNEIAFNDILRTVQNTLGESTTDSSEDVTIENPVNDTAQETGNTAEGSVVYTDTDLQALLVGKTLYLHCENGDVEWIEKAIFGDNNTVTVVEANGTTINGVYDIDGHQVCSGSICLELQKYTDSSLTFIDQNGALGTLYMTEEEAQHAPAVQCAEGTLPYSSSTDIEDNISESTGLADISSSISISEAMTFYSFEMRKENSSIQINKDLHTLEGGKVISKEFIFNLENGAWVEVIPNHYLLTEGGWVKESDHEETYVLNGDGSATIDGRFVIGIDEVVNIGNTTFMETETDGPEIAVLMPTGAMMYKNRYTTLVKQYYLWNPKTDMTSFSDLIQNQCGIHWFHGNSDGGIAFAPIRNLDGTFVKDSSGSYICDDTALDGTLVEVQRNTDGSVSIVDENAGWWSIEMTNDQQLLIVKPKSKTYYDRGDGNIEYPIFAIYDGSVWEGDMEPAGMTATWTSYNEIAFNALVSYIEKNYQKVVSLDSNETLLDSNFSTDMNTTDIVIADEIFAGKTYYAPVCDSYEENGQLYINNHIEKLVFGWDGKLSDSWVENGQNYETIWGYRVEAMDLLLSSSERNVTFSIEEQGEDYIRFTNGDIIYLDEKVAEEDLNNRCNSTGYIHITSEMLDGQTFYEKMSEDGGGYGYAKMTLTATDATRHEVWYNSDGTLREDTTFSIPYSIIDGKVRAETSDSYKWFTLNNQDSVAWYLVSDDDIGQDGTLDRTGVDIIWYLSKPSDFPFNL
ncbi:MAG: hypothetical protein DSY46_06380 [Hydrogenimonas sp.]|nr:MAG: hypothetical protein DSY46_06380 [Hydrogenimonas sp.]